MPDLVRTGTRVLPLTVILTLVLGGHARFRFGSEEIPVVVRGWQLCFECSFGQDHDRYVGDVRCADPLDSVTAQEYLRVINCTGPCEKRYTRLDEWSFSVVRQCTNSCRNIGYGDFQSRCCTEENHCNGCLTATTPLLLSLALPLALATYTTAWT